METFWKRKKINGKIVAPYTLYLLVFAHINIFLLVLYEWSSMPSQSHLEVQGILGVSLVVVAIVCGTGR